MNIHCIGIGGIGLSAIAQFCHTQNDTVSGSDQSETNITQMLSQKGISVSIGHAKENIPDQCDVVIYSEAIPETNPERIEAKKQNIPMVSYFEFLGHISKEFKTIAVAGTHGKTTTCGLIAAGALEAQFDATFFVGSILDEFQSSNFHAGTNQFAILEACEYRNNFQFLHPDIVLVTNIEWDHPDYYHTEESYLQAFQSFLSQAKTVIYHEDDLITAQILQNISVQSVAVSPLSKPLSRLSVFGDHNQKNAQLALALGSMLPIDFNAFQKGVQSFKGARRRQEKLGKHKDIFIFDDYGHHPTEITETLKAFQTQFPESRIGLIYEPHQFSRTHTFLDEFKESLLIPDFLGIYPIYEARDTLDDKSQINTQTLIAQIPNAQEITTSDHVDSFLDQLSENDILLFMGAGNISAFARDWIQLHGIH